MSLHDWNIMYNIKDFIGFDNYKEVFSDDIKPGAQLVIVGQGRLIDGSPLKITK